MNPCQKEYIYRINKVVDYIEKNIHEELTLEALAGVANFSVFHFSRIFSAFTGETLGGHIRRRRLEKAGRMLLNNPAQPVADIAWACGFNNVSVFCRNFREKFGMSAQEFRENRENTQNSKDSQTDSRNGQCDGNGTDYVCRVETIKHGGIMKENIVVKEMPALCLVYTRHIGAFHLIGQAYGRLMKWAGPRGLLGWPGMKTVTVYHDDPSITDIDKLMQSACITVEKPVKTEGEFGYMELPACRCAVGRFEISDTEFEAAWNAVCIWLSESGYQPADGYPYELYHNDHETHPERKFILDICVPVKPM